jgi:hypothetical protein
MHPTSQTLRGNYLLILYFRTWKLCWCTGEMTSQRTQTSSNRGLIVEYCLNRESFSLHSEWQSWLPQDTNWQFGKFGSEFLPPTSTRDPFLHFLKQRTKVLFAREMKHFVPRGVVFLHAWVGGWISKDWDREEVWRHIARSCIWHCVQIKQYILCNLSCSF